MEQRLREILAIVTDHQKFAEAKNGALLALDGALVLAVLQLLNTVERMDQRLHVYLLSVVAFAAISGLIALVSFVPQTRTPQVRTIEVPDASDTLVFFGDVQKYSVDDYLSALWGAANESEERPATPLERMYAQQVIVNARITARKFTYFKYAVWIVIAGLITPFVALLTYSIIRDHHTN